MEEELQEGVYMSKNIVPHKASILQDTLRRD